MSSYPISERERVLEFRLSICATFRDPEEVRLPDKI